MIGTMLKKQNTRLGVIGLGLMGSRFLRRLNAEGWNGRGWNRSRGATLPLKKYGFAIDNTVGDLVRKSEVLLSSLANDDAVRTTYLGENGVFTNVRPETTILEMSTISSDLSALFHQEARRRVAEMVDLLVSGSTPTVDSDTVTLLASGEPETFNRCVPIFESIARQWYLMGPSTAGVRMKLVATLLLGVNMEAIAEAVSLGEHLQLNRALLLDVLPKTAVIAPAFLGKFQKIKAGDYTPQFPLHLMSKDMALFIVPPIDPALCCPLPRQRITSFRMSLPKRVDSIFSAVTTYVQSLAKEGMLIGLSEVARIPRVMPTVRVSEAFCLRGCWFLLEIARG